MAELSCPECLSPLDNTYSCVNGHSYPVQNDVLKLLEAEFGARLKIFNQQFVAMRANEGRRILDPSIYPLLPEKLSEDPEWRARSKDLIIVKDLFRSLANLDILDIGAWNGWLSFHLNQEGHNVTAIDYFDDEFDGLAAMKHYPARWQAVQMDLENLDLIRSQFDLVVVNRCIQFFTNPLDFLTAAIRRVKPGGILLITGLAFFRDPQGKQKAIQQLESSYRQLGFEFFKPVRGYLDMADMDSFKRLGVRLKTERSQGLKNIKSRISPTSPELYYGIWQ